MYNPLLLPELREMLAAGDTAGMEEFCEALHPASTAEYMEGLSPEETWDVLKHTDVSTRVEIFSYFPREKQLEMLSQLDRKEMGRFIGDLPPDDRVDILDDLPDEVVEELLTHVPMQERSDILQLQSYEDGTAGGIMTTEFARLREDMTVDQVRAEFHRWAAKPESLETLYYLYVVDAQDHLIGVVSFRELALATLCYDDLENRLGDHIERNPIKVHTDQPQREVADIMARYDFLAVPVVDSNNRLVGIVTHDDAIDIVREEAADNTHRIGAVQPLDESYLETALLTLTRKRGVWLTILFFASMLTAGALDGYEKFTSVHIWLVAFIPLVISTGGNSGSQSATLVITAMSSGELTPGDFMKVLRRELMCGLLLGAGLGGIGFLMAWATLSYTQHDSALRAALVMPVTIVSVVTAGTVIGSSLPLLFRRLGWDPAIMSTPLVACLSDIMGILIYMTVAQLLL